MGDQVVMQGYIGPIGELNTDLDPITELFLRDIIDILSIQPAFVTDVPHAVVRIGFGSGNVGGFRICPR